MAVGVRKGLYVGVLGISVLYTGKGVLLKDTMENVGCLRTSEPFAMEMCKCVGSYLPKASWLCVAS